MDRDTETDYFISFLLLLFLALTFIVVLDTPKAHADGTSHESIVASSIHVNNDAEWADGTNLKSVWPGSEFGQSGTAASQYVSGPGVSVLEASSSHGNAVTSSSDFTYTNGGATWDTLTVDSSTPNESELACSGGDVTAGTSHTTGSIPDHVTVEAMTGAQGPSGRYVSDKLSSPDTAAISARFEGPGLFHSDYKKTEETGFDKNSNTLQHSLSEKRHIFASSNLTSTIQAAVDYQEDLMNFSDPFGLTPTNQTANETINQTASEEANTSEEA